MMAYKLNCYFIKIKTLICARKHLCKILLKTINGKLTIKQTKLAENICYIDKY